MYNETNIGYGLLEYQRTSIHTGKDRCLRGCRNQHHWAALIFPSADVFLQ